MESLGPQSVRVRIKAMTRRVSSPTSNESVVVERERASSVDKAMKMLQSVLLFYGLVFRMDVMAVDCVRVWMAWSLI